MRTALLLVFCAVILLPTSAAAQPKFEWILAPAPPAVRAAGWKGVHFSVDDKGRPWLFHDRTRLTSPWERLEFELAVDADDAIFLGNASPLVSSLGELGRIGVSVMTELDAGRPVLPVRPLRRMPGPACRLAPGAKRAVFALCDTAKGHEIFVLRPKEAHWRLLATGPEKPGAVAGDGDDNFASFGPVVVKLAKTPVPLWRSSSGDVRDLAYGGDDGLFYATDTKVGRLVGAKPQPLLDVGHAQIRVKDSVLYLFSEADWGVGKITGF